MHGHDVLHGIAATVLVASGAVLVPAAWLARRRAQPAGARMPNALRDRPVAFAPRLQATGAAALLLGAAVIHVAVAPEHLSHYRPFGTAVLVLATTQLFAAAAVLAFGVGRLRVPVVVITLGVMAVWAWSRTTGLPIGPEPWVPEPVGRTDGLASAFEAGLVLVLLAPMERWGAGSRGWRVDAVSVAMVPLVGVVGIATLVALASATATHH